MGPKNGVILMNEDVHYKWLHAIVEETLTSDKYILVFLISILNIYEILILMS